MDFGEVFTQTFKKAFSKPGFKLSLLAWGVTGLLLLPVFFTAYTQPEASTISFWTTLLIVPVSIIAAILVWIGSIRTFHEEEFDWQHFTTDAASTALKTIGTYIIVGLATVIGLVLLVIPGVIAYTALYIAIPILVLERASVTGAIRTSWSRTHGSRLAILGLAIILWLVTSAAVAPFQIGAVILGVFGPVAYALAIFLSSYVGVYAQLLTTAASVAVYEDIATAEDGSVTSD